MWDFFQHNDHYGRTAGDDALRKLLTLLAACPAAVGLHGTLWW
jgi:PleD family two-component response regulator